VKAGAVSSVLAAWRMFCDRLTMADEYWRWRSRCQRRPS
jgi:hypothetical protein